MRSCASRNEPLAARLAGQTWRLIEDEPAPGAWNMAVDEALLESARRDATPPTLRLYAWSRPTLSLGRHQSPDEGIDHVFRRARGMDLVRRPTGGRAVLHDQEVTYSIALPAALARGASVRDVYCALSGALRAGLEQIPGVGSWELGVGEGVAVQPSDRLAETPPPTPNSQLPTPAASCFATAAGGDLLGGAGKLVGSAQARRGGAALQHGSVLLEVRRPEWDGLFGGPGLEVGLAAGAAPVAVEVVRQALRRGLEKVLGARWKPGGLTPAERALAERLVGERYGADCLD